MAVVSVSFDGTIISAAESETDNGTWDQWQVSQSPVQESGFVLQNSFAISNKVSGINATGGVEFEDDATINFTSPKRVLLTKIMFATPGIMNTTVAEGMSYQIGKGVNGGTGYYNYYLFGLHAGSYPVLQSWLVKAIDPNENAYHDAISGTPTINAADWYGLFVRTNNTAKVENIIHDRFDYLTNGTGLTLVGGDGADPDGTFQSFLNFDFGTIANRMMVVFPGQAEIVVNGTLTIGTTTATVFKDANRFLVFPHHLVGTGFSGTKINMSHASTDVGFTACVFNGRGKVATKKFFDTSIQVNGTTEAVTVTAHGLSTGDYVLYSREGGSHNIGLTDATNYFVRAIDANTLAFYAYGATVGRQNSFTDTSRINLTAAGAPGENHSIVLTPDTRADHTVSGTTGVGVTWTACTIDGCRVLTLTSKATITGGFILKTGNIALGGGTLTDINISGQTTSEGVGLINTSDLDLISGCDFEAGSEGHAIRMTAATTEGWNNTHGGYWAPANNGWKFHTITGVDAATEIITTNANHGFTSGEAVYYNDEGGTDTIGLTDGSKYYVNVLSATTLSVHRTRAAALADSSRINLSDGSTGETHSLYSGRAVLFNDTASGTLTVNVTGGNAPSVRNAPGATTVVNQTVAVTFDKMKDNTEVRIYQAGTSTELAGIENATDGSPDNRNFVANVEAGTSVDYRIFNLTYEEVAVYGFTWPGSAQTINIQQRFDRNYENT